MSERVYKTRTDNPETLIRMHKTIEKIIKHMIDNPELWIPQGNLATTSTVRFADIVVCVDGSIHLPVLMRPDERQEELLGGMVDIMITHARERAQTEKVAISDIQLN